MEQRISVLTIGADDLNAPLPASVWSQNQSDKTTL
jgi:hypothetical protein